MAVNWRSIAWGYIDCNRGWYIIYIDLPHPTPPRAKATTPLHTHTHDSSNVRCCVDAYTTMAIAVSWWMTIAKITLGKWHVHCDFILKDGIPISNRITAITEYHRPRVIPQVTDDHLSNAIAVSTHEACGKSGDNFVVYGGCMWKVKFLFSILYCWLRIPVLY